MNTGTLIRSERQFRWLAIIGGLICLSTLALPFHSAEISPTDSETWNGLDFALRASVGTILMPPAIFPVLAHLSVLASIYHIWKNKPYKAAVSIAVGVALAGMGSLAIFAIRFPTFPTETMMFGYYMWFAGSIVIIVGSLKAHEASSKQSLPDSKTGWRRCLSVYKSTIIDTSKLAILAVIGSTCLTILVFIIFVALNPI